MLVFVIEIVIAVIGFGATLFITNTYERQIEKDKALRMMEQVITFTEEQVADERAYLQMYDREEISAKKFLNSSVANTDYYESILTSELILQNADMHIHGEIMPYLTWIDQATTRAREATEDKDVRTQMYWRYAYFVKVLNLLRVSYNELNESITQEEALEECNRIIYRDLNEEIKLYENVS